MKTPIHNFDDENWQEWFGIEYENPWQGFKHLEDPALDQTTRFLIQQLQDLYHGIVGNFDRPCTEQCNKVRLLVVVRVIVLAILTTLTPYRHHVLLSIC